MASPAQQQPAPTLTTATTNSKPNKKPPTPKELAKQEKAARRAAQKAAAGGGGDSTTTATGDEPGTPHAGGSKKGGAGGQKGGGHHGKGAGAAGGGKHAADSSASGAGAAATGGGGDAAGPSASHHGGGGGVRATTKDDPLQPFLHLDLPKPASSLSHSAKLSTANIHPSILRLALQYSEFKVVGANARCIAMLEAFKDVRPVLRSWLFASFPPDRQTHKELKLAPLARAQIITSYTPPPQTSLTRHLPTTHLNPQIAHLIRARPLSVSMGTAIRFLKYEISLIEMEMDLDEVRRPHSPLSLSKSLFFLFWLNPLILTRAPNQKPQAKQILLTKIDSFIRDRILLAGRVIEQHAIEKIKDGDVILTYARSSVVEGVLLEAKRQGKEFSVVVVDSRPLYEGESPPARGFCFTLPGSFE